MIATHSARHTSWNRDYSQRGSHGKYGYANRDKDTEGAPWGTGRECQEACREEYHCGQEHIKSGSVQQVCHVGGGLKRIGHWFQCPCQSQDKDSGHHSLKAFNQATHRIFKTNHAPTHHPYYGEHQCCERPDYQSHRRVAFSKGVHEIVVVFSISEKSSGVNHAKRAKGEQQQNGHHQIEHRAVFAQFLQSNTARSHFHLGVGYLAHAFPCLVITSSCSIKFSHSGEIAFWKDNHHNEDDGEKGVKIEGNCLTKEC